MRTLDELDKLLDGALTVEIVARGDMAAEGVTAELRQLIAVARAADALCSAWEQPSLDGFLKTVREARKAGLFGGEVEQ